MLASLFRKIFGSANERYIKSLDKIVSQINAFEEEISALSEEKLRAKTEEFRKRLSEGETLDDLLPESFAVVREASKRVLGMRHFDVQLKGGIILHRGMITEMKTGEGKTLVATLPVYLNALEGKGVHVVTVNDYLAQRDSEWMGAIYKSLGLTVESIVHDLSDVERQLAYKADITYATNNELGFDYLRDNMKFQLEEMVQRPFNYAIVDEVDSILIDEARTPLIISGPAEDSSELYLKVDALIPLLKDEDYEKDEKARSVTLTEKGSEHIETILRKEKLIGKESLYDVQNVPLVHHVNQALKAHKLFTRDVDYMVRDNKVMIIDEFTGRVMEGRRYSEGLHQALEAKESVEIQQENQTLASITYQNYFRLYPKLSGMTGTAMTEAPEFSDIYKLEVVEVPTNKKVLRQDKDDEIYRTAKEKYAAIIALIEDCRKRKQPMLVGTVSIEKSELLSKLLTEKKITHNVLNAKFHEKEAKIIAEAGVPGSITIATNMAGRGTDIKLGGNLEMRIAEEEAKLKKGESLTALKVQKIEAEIAHNADVVRKAGGLFVLGTERHESRRIDNQLRGRSGRQGDPGASKFFLSLEDDLMRIFGSERLDNWLQKLGLQEGEAIIHPWINKALEKAQQKVEARNFDMRKQLLKYDDVMNDQRKVIYEQRREVMEVESVQDVIVALREEVMDSLVERFIPSHAYAEQWETDTFHEECLRIFGLNLPIKSWAEEEGIADAEIKVRLYNAVNEHMKQKEKAYGLEMMRVAEKSLLLRVLDQQWKDHLLSLDHLRQGINLRAYGQRDPLNEYKGEAFEMFQVMLARLREGVTNILSHLQVTSDITPVEEKDKVFASEDNQKMTLNYHKDPYDPGETTNKTLKGPKEWGKTPRNAPCPCGSGKRYKDCHGKLS